MTIRYDHASTVLELGKSSLLYLSIKEGGRIGIDSILLSLWQQAKARRLTAIVQDFCSDSAAYTICDAALACLAEAGFLIREGEKYLPAAAPGMVGDLVSVIVVGYNSRKWLPDCITSLSTQNYSPLEIILVDNASSDDSAEWVFAHAPQVRLIRSNDRQSLAFTINDGIAAASGRYFLILNPDTRLEPDAIAQMVQVAQSDPTCAAVAAKLKFMWAPAFLNGIGNHVGAFAWGADNGLGYLDLGQFDHWDTISSACFAATLISRSAWEKVGKLDEKFPLYYEDNEWCYRARLMGYTIRAAPKAIVYHAFSGRVPDGTKKGMSPSKLENVVYGRLRFAIKLLSRPFLLRFLLSYTLEDLLGFVVALLQLKTGALRAYRSAWRNLMRHLPELLSERRIVQVERRQSDRELFTWQKQVPPPLIWHGLPVLTWDLIQHYYLPLILSGKTRTLPEFADVEFAKVELRSNWWVRVRLIWRNEGSQALVHRIVKYVQWRLAQI
ncbi:MAG: glycosyltransferase family 2 protein [Chloroflexi bacterium]|nr:glycosyltransferase family 2 protein [Chloroflexota bacterium]